MADGGEGWGKGEDDIMLGSKQQMIDTIVRMLPLVINSDDKPNIPFYSPLAQHRSFFRN